MNLSQIAGGGGDSYIGEIVTGNPSVLGINPTVGTKEYLLTGVLKRITGNSEYLAVVQQQPLLCYKDGFNNNQAWDYNNWGISRNQDRIPGVGWLPNYSPTYNRVLRHPNGNYFHCAYISCGWMYPEYGYGDPGTYGTFIKWGTNLNGGISGSHSRYTWSNSGQDWLINDFALFRNRIFYTVRSRSSDGSMQIYRSTGGDFSAWYNISQNGDGSWGNIDDPYGTNGFPYDWRVLYMAASPERLLFIPYLNRRYFGGNVTNSIFSTIDGDNILIHNFQPIPTSMARFYWSPIANTGGQGFTIVGTNSVFYTSANGQTWTTRTTAATALQGQSVELTHTTVAHSNTATVVCWGSTDGINNYLYRTTDGNNYSPVNLANFPSLRGIFCRDGVTGAASLHSIHYNGNNFILMSTQGAVAVSDDDGLNWQLRPPFKPIRMVYPRSRGTANGDFLFINPPDDYGRPLINAAVRIFPVTPAFAGNTSFQPNNIFTICQSSTSNTIGGANTGNTFVIANTVWGDGRPMYVPIEISSNAALSGNLVANTADWVGMIEKTAIAGNTGYWTSSVTWPYSTRPLETYVRIR